MHTSTEQEKVGPGEAGSSGRTATGPDVTAEQEADPLRAYSPSWTPLTVANTSLLPESFCPVFSILSITHKLKMLNKLAHTHTPHTLNIMSSAKPKCCEPYK